MSDDKEETTSENPKSWIAWKRKAEKLQAQLKKWENWQPDDETLKALQEQARARDGSYTNGLAAQAAYIGGLEAEVRRLRAVEAERDEWRDAYLGFECFEAVTGECLFGCGGDSVDGHRSDCYYLLRMPQVAQL